MNSITIMVFALFYIGFVSADVQDELRSQLEECKSSFNVSEDEIKGITLKQPPSSHEGKCYLHCIFSRMDVMTEEGKMNAEGMKGVVREIPNIKESDLKKLEKVADKCSEVSLGEDRCENAVTIYNCINTESDQLGVKGPEENWCTQQTYRRPVCD
uniref:Putative odorant-binding protein 3 n=1 Tax=Euschistus heros TaxID=437493 RepID=A0A097QH60_EUSHE|nr:putative odorant-binding protein 3 [Euschistus heros]